MNIFTFKDFLIWFCIGIIIFFIYACYARKPEPMCENGHQHIHCDKHGYFHADCPGCIYKYDVICGNRR
jgi:hypothetical protein